MNRVLILSTRIRNGGSIHSDASIAAVSARLISTPKSFIGVYEAKRSIRRPASTLIVVRNIGRPVSLKFSLKASVIFINTSSDSNRREADSYNIERYIAGPHEDVVDHDTNCYRNDCCETIWN